MDAPYERYERVLELPDTPDAPPLYKALELIERELETWSPDPLNEYEIQRYDTLVEAAAQLRKYLDLGEASAV